MILHNESLAIQKIQAEYNRNGLYGAMKLCQEFMGVDARAAYEKVRMLCNVEVMP
jgi:hypothetical protein